eukprot:905691_1
MDDWDDVNWDEENNHDADADVDADILNEDIVDVNKTQQPHIYKENKKRKQITEASQPTTYIINTTTINIQRTVVPTVYHKRYTTWYHLVPYMVPHMVPTWSGKKKHGSRTIKYGSTENTGTLDI